MLGTAHVEATEQNCLDPLTGDHDLNFSLKIFLIWQALEKQIDIAYHGEDGRLISTFTYLVLAIADNEG